MARSGLDVSRAGLWDVPADFRSQNLAFTKYLYIDAAYDQQQRMGQLYWATRNGAIVGYMMLAMGHADKGRQADLNIDTYGHIPALVIARLATDERHERQGIASYMTTYAIGVAGRMAFDTGCRLVLANSVPDAVGFYEKMGFSRFTSEPASDPGEPLHGPRRGADVAADVEDGLVPMYFDLGPRRF